MTPFQSVVVFFIFSVTFLDNKEKGNLFPEVSLSNFNMKCFGKEEKHGKSFILLHSRLKAGVGKVRPAGQIRPAEALNTARGVDF